MFGCLSRRVGVSFLALALFISGCEAPKARPYHLICWTDPPNCSQCRDDAPRVERLEKVMDVRFPDPEASPDHRIPYYKFYTPNGKLIYAGHDLSKVSGPK